MVWIVGLILIIGAGYLLFTSGGMRPASTTAEYVNKHYGYSFVYPAAYTLSEYTPEMQSIQDPNATDVHDLATVHVRSSTNGDTNPNFEAFVEKDAGIFCAADGPTVSMRCTGIASKEPFRSAGEDGLKFFLNKEVKSANGAVASSTWGPLFAFQLSKTATSSFTALYIVPPLSMIDTTVASYPEALAKTVRID